MFRQTFAGESIGSCALQDLLRKGGVPWMDIKGLEKAHQLMNNNNNQYRSTFGIVKIVLFQHVSAIKNTVS